MADEFVKGLGIAVTAGLGWMILSAWYNTPTFNSNRQMLHPPPENLDIYGQMAMVLRDALLVFLVLGVLTFWILIPAVREARAARN
ncbi:hypothetical protein BRC81_13245 [Halobacteriales archaeon QS_1_68_20]|nr:MAG: hypothetical protein BRC81_13245 [Halobacteriales archaeon QS_1_68_20]